MPIPTTAVFESSIDVIPSPILVLLMNTGYPTSSVLVPLLKIFGDPTSRVNFNASGVPEPVVVLIAVIFPEKPLTI